jgi:hypothetical protein
VYSGCGERDVGALYSVVREQLVWPVVPVELRIWVVSQSLQCTAVWCVDQLSVKGCLSLSVHNERLSDDFSVPSSNRNRRQHLIANTSPQTCDASRSPARSGDALSRGRTAHEPRCEPGDAACGSSLCPFEQSTPHSTPAVQHGTSGSSGYRAVQYSSPSYRYLLANRNSQHTFASVPPHTTSTTTTHQCRGSRGPIRFQHSTPLQSQVRSCSVQTDRKKPSDSAVADGRGDVLRGVRQ